MEIKPVRNSGKLTQCAKLIEALRKMRAANTYQLRDLGISHPAGRVNDLEAEGYKFLTIYVKAESPPGVWHDRVAQYSLVPSEKVAL